jgi:hypothetical protein
MMFGINDGNSSRGLDFAIAGRNEEKVGALARGHALCG